MIRWILVFVRRGGNHYLLLLLFQMCVWQVHRLRQIDASSRRLLCDLLHLLHNLLLYHNTWPGSDYLRGLWAFACRWHRSL